MSKAEGSDLPEAGERKDRVLHTRIPGSLDREIKRRAGNLGMSVSTVVRNVLLHTFDLVEDIVNDSANLALTIADEKTQPREKRSRARRPIAAGSSAEASILGWQELILNVNAVCERCNAILSKGSEAAVAVHDSPSPRTIICPDCLATARAQK